MGMSSLFTVAMLGFLLGLRHATDADHVVAVTNIVAQVPSLRRAAWIGALWGIGHSLTLLVVGGGMVAFRWVLSPRVGLGLEFGVAMMLILLGFNNLRQDQHADHTHLPTQGSWRPLLIGVVHGLAGSAAIALLVLATISESTWALAYLAIFGLGTIAGMMMVTTLLAAPALYFSAHVLRFQQRIRLAAGSLSVVFGLVLAYEIVVNQGFFEANPVWTPQ